MISASEAKVEILADPEALSRRVADWMLELATAKNGVFAVALSGGSTPRGLYERLAGPPYIDAFPWSRTHWFWGDERFVPHDNPLSNYRMVREALLSRAPVPAITWSSPHLLVSQNETSSTIGEPSGALKPAQAAPSTGRITSLAPHADEKRRP